MELKEVIGAVCIIITMIALSRTIKIQQKKTFQQRSVYILKKLLLLYALVTAVSLMKDTKTFIAVLAFIIINNEFEK